MVASQRHAPVALPPADGPVSHRTGYWVGLRAGLEGRAKSRSSEIRPPDRSDRRKSLHLLRYPGSSFHLKKETNLVSEAFYYVS